MSDRSVEAAVRELGEIIGYGRLMQEAERIWDQKRPGVGEAHSVGCCTSFLVPCPHPDGRPPDCEWCCGSGRVTKRVLEAMLKRPAVGDFFSLHVTTVAGTVGVSLTTEQGQAVNALLSGRPERRSAQAQPTEAGWYYAEGGGIGIAPMLVYQPDLNDTRLFAVDMGELVSLASYRWFGPVRCVEEAKP